MTVPLNYICYQKTDCYTQDSSLFCKIHFFIPLLFSVIYSPREPSDVN